MALGAALVLSALSLFLWNWQEDQAAGTAVKNLLPQLMEQMESPPAAPPGEEPTGEAPVYPDPYDPAMTEVEIDGYGYIGYLSIPSAGLELPVMSQWDYDRLKIAPCRYTGSVRQDNLTICAHNYKRHFGPVRDLNPGDEVFFTDMDGVTYPYTVAAVETLAPTAVEAVTSGDYDLVLFTCTYGGRTRVAVGCDRVREESR